MLTLQFFDAFYNFVEILDDLVDFLLKYAGIRGFRSHVEFKVEDKFGFLVEQF